ncbi:RNA helicase Mov10l1-like [Leguminivora glycinivorella]|uniref:RNA helicase Mov10l1-like n=1 Tax=Leguminivora glycinivorella TaxID=1035111 RepID=UPI00200E528C|nr:RNA helicase Mov10l1-like [Leguminivora glycinivorella]XP_047994419.1 RNA helicase Mov10l1-like [Leguminivora glycinivorella]
MAPRCGVCLEDNVEAGHEQSQKHLKNLLLDQLGKINKQYADNRNGIVVTSTVTPVAYNAAPFHVDTDQSVLKVSVKPREGVNFTFKIKNDNEADIIFRGISIPNNKFNFTLLDENLSFGSVSCRIHPRTFMEEEVCVTFENSINGVYKQPVYFIFIHADTEEYTVILKEMLVYVEAVKRKHEKVDSPYTLQPILADKLERTTAHKKGEDDVFVIPSKVLKKIFFRDLKVDEEDGTDEEKALVAKVKAIFEAGPHELNYVQFFHNLLWYEETVVGANLKNYNMSGVTLKRSHSGKSYSLVVPGLAEKRPSLMLGDLVYVRPHNQTEVMYEAIITDIQDSLAQFSKISDKFHKLYKKESKFDIRFCMSRMPLERMHVAVDNMRREHMQTKTFPKGNEVVPAIKRITNFYNPLIANNAEQHAVVEHIVAGSSGTAPYLLHGPPGTGKTVTIVEAILQLAKSRSNRILVCTHSNMAADHVATLLIQYADKFPGEQFLLRANSEFRVWETMPEILGPYSNGVCRESWTRVTIAKFISYSIVITTLVHAAKFAKELKQKNKERMTTHVFIDEAAQASEPASLIPLCGLLKPGGALILAGDPLQLGPVVISKEASKLGLGVSLMERLKRDCALYSDERRDPNYIMMLKKNFRSHRDILSIPDELFYHGQLEAMAPVDYISSVDILGERPTSRAIVFYGVPSQEQRIGKSPSFYNDSELEVVQNHITKLLEVHRVAEADIGVVTPYIRQVYKMKQWLKERELNIEVGTVEGFQGKEKRIIIVSTVRAKCELLAHDAKFRLGFLVDAKRFNVALTRAKAKLIVIGNPACLQKDSKWRRYIAKCRELGTYCGLDFGESEAAETEAVDQIAQILRLTRALENMRV